MSRPSPARPDRDAFDRDGLTVVAGVISGDEVTSLRNLIDHFVDTGTAPTRQVLYTHAEPTEPRPGMERLMHQWLNPHLRAPAPLLPPIAAVRSLVTAILDEPPVLFQDVLLEKRLEHAAFPWHQDLPYWPVDRADGVIAWIALDRVDADAGGVHLIRASHLRGEGPPIDLHTGAPQSGSTRGEIRPAGEVVCPSLAPGDAILFHSLAWHCSPPKRREGRRRAWASSWLSRGTRWQLDRAPRHPLAGRVENGSIVTEWTR